MPVKMRPKPKTSRTSCKTENRRMGHNPNRYGGVSSTPGRKSRSGHRAVSLLREVVAERQQECGGAEEDELRIERAILVPDPGNDGPGQAIIVERNLVLELASVSVERASGHLQIDPLIIIDTGKPALGDISVHAGLIE